MSSTKKLSGRKVIFPALIVIVMGSATPIPLLPYYRIHLGLPPESIALIFNAYLATMVLSLAVSSLPGTQSRPRVVLTLSLCAAGIADLLFLTETPQTLMLGRVASGLSVGFGIGAASTLAAKLLGPKGRSIAATGTMLAGLAAILMSGLLADFTSWPSKSPYIVHLVLVIATTLTMLLADFTPTGQPDRPGAPKHTPTEEASKSASPPWYVSFSGLIGIISWSMGNMVVALGPMIVQQSTNESSLLRAAAVALLVAGFGAVGQYVLLYERRLRLSTWLAAFALSLGATSFLVGAAAPLLALLWIGGALVGLGQGVGYRSGLLVVTKGLPYWRHGARTSSYACLAYISATLAVQAGGLLMPS